MIDKQEFFKLLYKNAALNAALQQLKTEKEKNQIKACIDDVVGKLYDSVMGVYVPVQNNTELIKNISKEESSESLNQKLRNEDSENITKKNLDNGK